MVWRGSEHLEIEVALSNPRHLVPIHSHDVKPAYFTYAGMIFTKLTAWYLRSQYGVDWQAKAPIKLCERAVAGAQQHEGQEVVILTKVRGSWELDHASRTCYIDFMTSSGEDIGCCVGHAKAESHALDDLKATQIRPEVRI